MTIPEWILTGALSLFCVIIGWGIKRLVGGHDTLTEHVAKATGDIAEICGDIKTAVQIQAANKEVCDERDRNNLNEHERILDRLERLN